MSPQNPDLKENMSKMRQAEKKIGEETRNRMKAVQVHWPNFYSHTVRKILHGIVVVVAVVVSVVHSRIRLAPGVLPSTYHPTLDSLSIHPLQQIPLCFNGMEDMVLLAHLELSIANDTCHRLIFSSRHDGRVKQTNTPHLQLSLCKRREVYFRRRWKTQSKREFDRISFPEAGNKGPCVCFADATHVIPKAELKCLRGFVHDVMERLFICDMGFRKR